MWQIKCLVVVVVVVVKLCGFVIAVDLPTSRLRQVQVARRAM